MANWACPAGRAGVEQMLASAIRVSRVIRRAVRKQKNAMTIKRAASANISI